MKDKELAIMNEQGASHWWYLARSELLKHALKNFFVESQNLKILDLASACGNNFSICSNYGKTFCVDISWHAINFCKQKNITTVIQGDAERLAFKTGTFDVVLVLDVFEHLKDDVSSLKEITRVLKENGKLIFNTPAFMFLFSYHDVALSHRRRYVPHDLKKKMDSANLQVKFITYWSFFIFPVILIIRRFSNYRKKNDEEILSDFYRKIPPFIEIILRFLSKIELFFIKRNISLPFGISLFGLAQKR